MTELRIGTTAFALPPHQSRLVLLMTVAQWMVFPWVQRQGWILGIGEAHHGTGSSRPKRRREFLKPEDSQTGAKKRR